MNANELGFSGLLVYCLRYYFINVKWFKTFYDTIKPLIESEDSKMYFCEPPILLRVRRNSKDRK